MASMDRIDMLVNRIEARGEEIVFAGPASDEVIQELEKAIEVEVSPTYRTFLSRFGAALFADREISGIHDGDPYVEQSGSVFAVTQRYRRDHDLPDTLIVVQAFGETPLCLDTTVKNDAGEYPVVVYESESGSSTKIAENFRDYFVHWWLELIVDDLEEGFD